ncbi:MAG: HD domain-containing protein [Planctomycetota bacterium]
MNFPDGCVRRRPLLVRIESTFHDRLPALQSWIHGRAHLREVSMLAGWIAQRSEADVEAAMVAGFLHDCGRVDDGGGNRHAHDSATIARRLLPRTFAHLPIGRICEAIARHADGQITDDPLAGALWDADRLTLTRLGRDVREDLLSTEPGRRLLARRQGHCG